MGGTLDRALKVLRGILGRDDGPIVQVRELASIKSVVICDTSHYNRMTMLVHMKLAASGSEFLPGQKFALRNLHHIFSVPTHLCPYSTLCYLLV